MINKTGEVEEANIDIQNENQIDTPESDLTDKKENKKGWKLQWPVIVSIVIVLASFLGYFLYTAFLLKEPDGKFFFKTIIWENEIDGATYYYEFNSDSTLKVYQGSTVYETHFEKLKTSDGNKLGVDVPFGSFIDKTRGGYADYKITGSRILGNQTLECTYSNDTTITLKQASGNTKPLTLPDMPDDVTTDSELTGTWNATAMNGVECQAVFKDDGTMSLRFYYSSIDSSATYNGVYTIKDSAVNFTFYQTENETASMDYYVNGDQLYFMNLIMTREGTNGDPATTDQTN